MMSDNTNVAPEVNSQGDLESIFFFNPHLPFLLQALVHLLPGSYLGKLGLFQAPNLIELVVDAYKVQSPHLLPLHLLSHSSPPSVYYSSFKQQGEGQGKVSDQSAAAQHELNS